MTYKEKYEKWLKADLPQDLKEQLESLNEEEINDCFYCDLELQKESHLL